MSVAHVDSVLEESATPGIGSRLALLIGGVTVLALAAVPAVFVVLLVTRPDLLLSR